jgi:sugar lactone lactonase YvrE
VSHGTTQEGPPLEGGVRELEPEVLFDGLAFSEGPRWYDGRLWCSDMNARQVLTVDLVGSAERVVEVPGKPSGLAGFRWPATQRARRSFHRRAEGVDFDRQRP